MPLCEACKARDLKAMRLLESLTPSGSEFVNEPERCAEFARQHSTSQHQTIIRLTKERNALQDRVLTLELEVSHYALGDAL